MIQTNQPNNKYSLSQLIITFSLTTTLNLFLFFCIVAWEKCQSGRITPQSQGGYCPAPLFGHRTRVTEIMIQVWEQMSNWSHPSGPIGSTPSIQQARLTESSLLTGFESMNQSLLHLLILIGHLSNSVYNIPFIVSLYFQVWSGIQSIWKVGMLICYLVIAFICFLGVSCLKIFEFVTKRQITFVKKDQHVIDATLRKWEIKDKGAELEFLTEQTIATRNLEVFKDYLITQQTHERFKREEEAVKKKSVSKSQAPGPSASEIKKGVENELAKLSPEEIMARLPVKKKRELTQQILQAERDRIQRLTQIKNLSPVKRSRSPHRLLEVYGTDNIIYANGVDAMRKVRRVLKSQASPSWM